MIYDFISQIIMASLVSHRSWWPLPLGW